MSKHLKVFPGYALLDSGEGEKLERFGEVTIVRPSSLAIWQKRKDHKFWATANARYIPSSGWKFNGRAFEDWIFPAGDSRLELRLQKNGQVGIFPDHATYLEELLGEQKRLSANGPVKVLNLFAYTGMSTVILAQRKSHVCHVDLSKQAISWAARNVGLNLGPENSLVRFICEDALQFVQRELRRKSRYDIVIADPPSFGRISKTKSWKFEDIARSLIASCLELISDRSGAFFLTCHHSALGAEVLGNLLSDAAPNGARISARSLFIHEKDTVRQLPAGHLAVMSV